MTTQAQTPRRAVAIIRVSQRGARTGGSFRSPADQRAAIDKLCEAEGLTLVGEPYDESDSVSGDVALEDRPGLAPAVQDIVEGRAEALVADDDSRLWWNHETEARVRRLVRVAGGRIYTESRGRIDGGEDDDPEVEAIGSMRTMMNRYVRRVNARKSWRAVEARISEGIWPTNQPPVGYDIVDKRLVPNEHAPLVREAFAMRDAGATIFDIRGFLAAHGVQRAMQAIVRMLSNRAVLGEIHFGDHTPAIGAHAPIVAPDLFARVVGGRRQTAGRKPSADRLLNRLGVLRCACGSRMSLSTSGRGQTYYRCANVDCSHRAMVGTDVAERVVLDATRERLAGETARADAEDEARIAAATASDLDDELAGLVRAFVAAGLADDATATDELAAKRQARDAARDRAEHLAGRSGVVELLGLDVFDALVASGAIAELRDVVASLGLQATVLPGKGPDRVRVQPLVEQAA